MVRAAYQIAVVGWGMRPQDFWALHPAEFHWLCEGQQEKHDEMMRKSGKIPRSDALEMYEDLKRQQGK